jgi:hypothetical protein
MHYKSFVAAEGFSFNLHRVLVITAQACLPILHLGIDWYSGWKTVIVYPSSFSAQRHITDEFGVVHPVRESMHGEAWLGGPVILSWPEAETAGVIDGENLVIHEFAHKLDMQNGAANGMPPLHDFMSRQYWTESFQTAFDDFSHRVEHGKKVLIDHYAATDPAEFFAVVSEVFFERPDLLQESYPDVYENLKQFYCQKDTA